MLDFKKMEKSGKKRGKKWKIPQSINVGVLSSKPRQQLIFLVLEKKCSKTCKTAIIRSTVPEK
jgi:hypothetical protein